MKLKSLEAFLHVADLGSLSRAAKVMGTTQSFVSRQIAQLEVEWGDKLFERTGRGMILSHFGEGLRPHVSQLFDNMRELEAAVRDNAGALSGVVRIGVVPSMARRLIPMLFTDLQQRAPAVQLHFVEEFTGILDELLSAGKLDMAIMNRFDEMHRTDEDLLGSLDTLLVGPAAHPLLRRSRIRLRELDRIPLVLAPAPNGLRSHLVRQARTMGIEINIRAEVNSLAAMVNIVSSCDAFTILGGLAVDMEVSSGRLATSQIYDAGMTRSVSLALTRHHPMSRPARMVATRVRELATHLLHEDPSKQSKVQR